MNGFVGAAPPGAMFVRALYNYEADDRTSLSFHEGDVIQVITQLESGWWDGVINGVRGWFPSNYCQVIESPDEIPDTLHGPAHDLADDNDDDQDNCDDEDDDDNHGYDDHYENQVDHDGHDDEALDHMHAQGVASSSSSSSSAAAAAAAAAASQQHAHVQAQAHTQSISSAVGPASDDFNSVSASSAAAAAAAADNSRPEYWIPQITADGRLYYYNTETGEQRAELPLESPASCNETGPVDRMNVTVPDRTRLPPEMMARGMMQEEDDDSDQLSRHNQRSFSGQLSPSASMDSINGVIPHHNHNHNHIHNQSRGRQGSLIPSSINSSVHHQPSIASATSFTTNSYNLPSTANISRSFFDDGSTPPLTWTLLVQNMKQAIDRYRDVVSRNDRSQYVARAEDISDHLRLLLAAGSGTTDNHSGQPSIISQNKALYPHFRDMMSKFSKLVISSHIAASDWPNADSVQKCLVEAEGVFQGVFNYVEVARQQRGEEIPRLFPGFVIGSITGGSWQNNGIGPRDKVAANFYDDDDGPTDSPSALLDEKLLANIDDMKRLLISSLRELDKTLVLNDKIVSAVRHEIIGNNICAAGSRVLDAFKSWISLVENIDMSSIAGPVQSIDQLGMFTNPFQTFANSQQQQQQLQQQQLQQQQQQPTLVEFFTSKQSIYDNIADLVLGCQAITGPLADEWSEVRGEALENRLEYVRQCSTVLETNSTHLTFNLQGLVAIAQRQQQQLQQQQLQQQLNSQGQRKESLSARGVGVGSGVDSMRSSNPYDGGRMQHQRQESRSTGGGGSGRPSMLHNPSYDGSGSSSNNPNNAAAAAAAAAAGGGGGGDSVGNFRKGDMSKVKKIFGEDPSPQAPEPSTPPHLMLDLEHEISWETKTTPHTVKGGTLEALVEQLTRHDKLDSSFNNTFLLTYRSFTSARELFELLVQRFSIQPPEGLGASDYEQWRAKKQTIVRLRVVNILKNWFDNFWMEEYTDESKQLMRDVYNFARDTVKTTETPGSAPLMTVVEQRMSGKEAGARRMVQNLDRGAPPPIMPKNMKKLKFLDIDVVEFARQLTIIESRLYSKIKATECLNKTWQKKVGEGEAEPAPNVKALILHSNQMTNWVAEMILAQMDVRKRVVVIKHFVMVAEKCRAMNNFSTLTSIISALGTAPISRLKRTWDQVTQRTQNSLETMRTLMASTKNFGEYREALHAANPPCIPFFGI
ncbi:hypothetical protein TD95_005366, partial [Thielaviopsis punctulata]